MNLVLLVNLFIYGLFYLLIFILWLWIRNYLKENEKVKNQLVIKNRTVRNYDVFVNTLYKQEKKVLPEPLIVLGNKESSLELTIFTSLYCKMCKDICEIIDRILFAFEDEIRINIFFKKQSLEDKNTFLYVLHHIFLQKGEQEFLKALNFWFENKNLDPWKIPEEYDQKEDRENVTISNEWFFHNEIVSTPSVFINGFMYPSEFEKQDLYYHIEGIIENNR